MGANTDPWLDREREVFLAALERPSPAERAAFLDAVCGKDGPLRARLEALLRHHSEDGFLEEPAADLEGTLVSEPLVRESAGTVIGRYKLLQKIGEGGMGVVYMAQQEEPVRRRVALKIIKLGMDTKQVVARFEAERQALALMDHPNIAKVLDGGATDTGRPYFVMELVPGVPITQFCDRNRLTTEERIKLFIPVCQAIQSAHQKGIIHRDLKPTNVLVTLNAGAPMPMVIDFGVAKATNQKLTEKTCFTNYATMIGTPAYMSPEQAEMSRLDVDTRSDIYGLGVLLYELLTGTTPFPEKRLRSVGYQEMQRIILEEEPERPSTRLSTLAGEQRATVARNRRASELALGRVSAGDLDWIVMKCLEKDRVRRYETANGLARDLERHLKSEPVVARPPSQMYRFQKLVQRNRLACAAAGAVVAALVLGFIVSTQQAIRARRAEQAQSHLLAEADTARRQAEVAQRQAKAEARRAEAAATEARMTLAGSDFSEATRLIEGDEVAGAVAYLLRILSADPDHGAALARLATLMTYRSWMTPAFSLPHGAGVLSVQFSPDGRRVVTSSEDHTARVWDAQTGLPVTGPLKHGNQVFSAQFSPDGGRVVTASYDHTARVWDARTGRPLTAPLKHLAEALSAQFSPDGRRVVSSSADHTARVWDAQTGQPLTEPLQHGDRVSCAQFSPDGRRVVTASHDHTARVWDAQTGQPLTEPLEHGGWVISAQFSPEGQRVVTASWDHTARVWDAQTGRPLTEPLKHEDGVPSAQFSPEGNRVVTASWDHTARVWDARTGQPLTEPLKHGDALAFAQFSPDGQRVVTAAYDHTARLWDARTGQPLTEPLKHGNAVFSVRFSPDGTRLITASIDGAARVWDAQTGPPLIEPLKHGDEVNWAQFSPDGRRLVTASADHTARVWDAQTDQPLTGPLKHENGVLSAQFSPDGQRVVTAARDHTARVWDAQTGQPLTGPLKHENAVFSAQFSPDSRRVVTASQDQTARVWDAQTGQPLTGPLNHGNAVLSAQFSPEGRRVVTASADATARVWDAQTGQPVTEALKHGSVVVSAQFSPDGQRVVTAAYDNTARVWDAQTGQALTEPLKHGSRLFSAQFSPDGRRIVTASEDKTARVWDAQSGQPSTEPLKHAGEVLTAQFSPDGQRVVTASVDGTARVWDAQTGQPLIEPLKHGNWVNSAQFSPDGRRVVTAARDNAARVWDVGPAPSKCPGWLLSLAEALAGSRLDKRGILEPTALERAQTIAQIRRSLEHLPDHEAGVLWGRWLLADRASRALSPLSSMSVPAYIQNRINESTAASLDEAQRLASGNAELSARVLEMRAIIERAKRPKVLEGEAQVLAGQGELAKAEAKYREALRAGREVWTNQPVKWESCLKGLVDVLLRERRFDDAEGLFREVLTPGFVAQPQAVALLRARGAFLARRGRWKDAAADFSRVIEFDPADHRDHHWLAPLLVQGGDREAYRRHCAQALACFGRTQDPIVAERMTKDCLMLPLAGADLDAVAQWAETAVTKGKGDRYSAYLAFFEFAKGLAEYRQGHFASAVDWTRKVVASTGTGDAEAQAYFVLAMALHQSGQAQESRAALAKGTDFVETKMPKLESGDIGDAWIDWIVARTLMSEAKGLIEGRPAAAGDQPLRP